MAAPGATATTTGQETPTAHWNTGATVLTILLLACAFVVGAYLAGVAAIAPVALWACVVAFVLAALGVAGVLMCGRFTGFLITENNVMSASRAQAALWFVAILSTYVTLWCLNFRLSPADPVALTEGALLASVAASGSMVGAQLLNAPKSQRKLTHEKLQEVQKLAPEIGVDAEAKGVLWRNKRASQAKLKDIFEGDEVVEGGALDAGKVQMLVLTLVLVLLYVARFLATLADANPPNAVPDIDTTVASLLGLSHAGYLGNKLPTRTV